jgi:hypothetical protein
VRSKIAFLGRYLAIVLVIRSWPGDLLFKFLMIFRTSEREVCFIGRHIGRVFRIDASILE